MPMVLVAICCVLLVIGLFLLAWVRTVKRWKRTMDVSDDTRYVETLAILSADSVRRHFNPYTDISWEAPEFSVTRNDPRWVLSATDPLGRHPWYKAQSLEKQIAIGMWRQANAGKVSIQLENLLIRGLMQYTFWVPNGSPEYRYCLHETVEECNHSMMFQEMVNRIGVDVPGGPRWLRWLSVQFPIWAGPLPSTFFFGVLAGEVPIDYLQRSMLREGRSLHPILENVMAVHVAEEARHLSFAHEYLHKRVPHLRRPSRFVQSLYVPIIMRALCQAIVVPKRSFFREFDIPRSVRKELFFDAPDSRQTLRDMFGDVRMLCHDVGLMNPVARWMWRICKIDGPPSRYRGEPQRAHPPTRVTAA
jgi:P-aminobenzoate N-oxygenase AurF